MANTILYELDAYYDSCDSFNHKAYVLKHMGEYVTVEELYSHRVHVATVTKYDGRKTAKVLEWFSQATGRHIKEFLNQHGFISDTKQNILKYYGVNNLESEV